MGALLISIASVASAEKVWLSSLDIKSYAQEWGTLQKNKDVEGKEPLSIAGKTFKNGLGTHAPGYIALDLGGGSEQFTALTGVNDQSKGRGSVEFIIYGDGKELWKSGVMRGGDAAQKVDISVKGVHELILEVTDAGDGYDFDHADWVNASLEVTGVKPKSYELSNKSDAVILTPKPGPQPRINGPTIFGVRPGSPFIYSIPATGELPITFAADGLPEGLTLDTSTGRISGSLNKKETYTVKLHAKNKLGSADKAFRIVVGDQIALTPPMGWNSWNCFGETVSQEKVLAAARAFVEKGLNLHGWTYINIDDGWQGVRGGTLNAIQPNGKFPDMKGLGNTLHGMGLKFGIYSTPWRGSYAGHIGSSSDNADGTYDWVKSGNHNADFHMNSAPGANYKFGTHPFIEKDVEQWAEWGVDYLKYDWYPIDVPHVEAMSQALKASGRDIIYSLSNSADIKSAVDYAQLASSWRTTGDINDSWNSVAHIGFHQDKWAQYAGPGHFNDPDMLVVGSVGWGTPHPTQLTPDEQYTHISLWALLSAPLLIGCDLSQLDDFTANLLTNDEVLEVDQDALVQQAVRVSKNGFAEVFAKPLEDGSWAVGLFNRGPIPEQVTIDWSALKLAQPGPHKVRDLWRQKDLDSFPDKFSAVVAPHGVVLIRVF